MNRPQKPATRKLKIFKAMSRKGAEEVLVYLLKNGTATFEELKSLYKESTLRCILGLLMKAKLIKTRKSKEDRRFVCYLVNDESLVIDLVELLSNEA